MKITELPDGPFRRKVYRKLLAFVLLMYVGELVLLLFFEVLLKGVTQDPTLSEAVKVRVCQTKTVDPKNLLLE